jgi:glutaconyl-CoA decarboxylase
MGTHRFKIEGRDFEVRVGTRSGSRVDVTVNGKSFAVEVDSPPSAAAAAATPPPAAPVIAATTAPAIAVTAGAGDVLAPISGVVLSVDVKPGQRVEPQTRVLVLEAMKMENEIFAATTGTVTQVHVQAQQDVREDDLLISITPG